MEAYLHHQAQLVSLFASLHRHAEPVAFMKSIQDLLVSLKTTIMNEKRPLIQQYHFAILTILYKLIPYTRDVYGGLGERELAYRMLFIWHYHFPVPAATCLHRLVLPREREPPFGSWRDIKGMCNMIRTHSDKGQQDPFVETCVGMINHQLELDQAAWDDALDTYIRKKDTPASIPRPVPSDAGISLVCKWIPREHSANDWIFQRALIQWLRGFRPHYLQSCKDKRSFDLALKKGAKEYRRLFTRLSKAWGTVEIQQCTQNWASIQHDNVPFVAAQRQQQAFLNIGLSGNPRKATIHNDDRHVCAAKTKLQWETNRAYKQHHLDEVNPLFVDMGELIKRALRVSHADEIARLEHSWNHVLAQVEGRALEKTVPLVHTGLFVSCCDRFYEALGMAILVAFKGSKRLVLYDQNCHVVSLEGHHGLRSILQLVLPIYREHHVGNDVEKATTVLVDALRTSGMGDDEVFTMKLAWFATFDDAEADLVAPIEKAFAQTRPFLLLWRGFGTAGKDALAVTKTLLPRTVLFSGASNYVWTRIAAIPEDKWGSLNAFDFVAHLLGQPRYNGFEDYFKTLLQPKGNEKTH